MRSLKLRTLAATAAFCGSAAFAQVVNVDQPVVNLADGPVSVAATFDLPGVSWGMGPQIYPRVRAQVIAVPPTEVVA